MAPGQVGLSPTQPCLWIRTSVSAFLSCSLPLWKLQSLCPRGLALFLLCLFLLYVSVFSLCPCVSLSAPLSLSFSLAPLSLCALASQFPCCFLSVLSVPLRVPLIPVSPSAPAPTLRFSKAQQLGPAPAEADSVSREHCTPRVKFLPHHQLPLHLRIPECGRNRFLEKGPRATAEATGHATPLRALTGARRRDRPTQPAACWGFSGGAPASQSQLI